MLPQPQCANHDDGETFAQIVCAECGPLCVDCDRVLHLSRKFRTHQRQVYSFIHFITSRKRVIYVVTQ